MEYKVQRREDCDKTIKLDNIQILLYSEKRLQEIAPNARIVGEVVLSKRREKDEQTDVLLLGKRELIVWETDKVNRLANRTAGYVAVGDDAYIRVFDTRVPFLILLASMVLVATVSVAVILLLPAATPAPAPELENPLPMIDPYAVTDPDFLIPDDATSDAAPGGGMVNISFRPTATWIFPPERST